MGWEDRPYYRDRGASSNPLVALLSGSVPMFKAFGIRVRAHNSLILFILWELFVDWWTPGYTLANRIVSVTLLFGIILLHEFGHCAAARMVGGDAEQILLWPLGGLAFPDVPRRWGAHFWTAAGGPLVNVGICIISAAAVYFLSPMHFWMPLNPFHSPIPLVSWRIPVFYFWWTFELSFLLLLFNMLPIYPLDGGQMLQAVLWRFVGHYRSMMFACITGMCGSAMLGILGLVQLNVFLVVLAACLFFNCYQQRMILRETGPSEPWQEMEVDYSSSLYRDEQKKQSRGSKRAARIARKRARQETMERQKLDAVLSKVSTQGIKSLKWRERRILRRATDQRRKNEIELKSYIQE